MKARTWFTFKNEAQDPSVVDIQIVDFIGSWYDEAWRDWGVDPGVTAKQFLKDLAALNESVKTIRVRINSPGGDVFAAVHIANALRDQQASKGRTVETIVDGLAASAASIVAMAGSTITMADNALMMVHNPWSWAVGNAKDMRRVADELDTIRNAIMATYKWHATVSDEDIIALLDAETWMAADEAIAKGFATNKVEGLRAAASIDRRTTAKLTVPDKYRARVDALLAPEPTEPTPMAAADVLTACSEAGLDIAFAQSLISAKATSQDVTAKVAQKKTELAAAGARATEIEALCKKGGFTELAQNYIASGMSVDAIKNIVTVHVAKVDGARGNINTDINPDTGASRSQAELDPAAIYASRKPQAKKE